MFDINLFMDQMEENTMFNLLYPFRLDLSKMKGNYNVNVERDVYHFHRFVAVLKIAYLEPFAFYLSEEDKKYYSAQELEFIDKVIACEKEKVQRGMEMMTFDLDDETLEYLENYRIRENLTMEEAINRILKEIIKRNEKK